MRKIFMCIALCTVLPSLAYAQDAAGVRILPEQGELYEKTKTLDNPYALPLWGNKLGSRGFLLPYPIGVMVNGYISSQDVTISDLSIGINDNPMIPLDKVVGFSDVTAHIQNMNIRTDLWILPFLDIYGVFGKAWVQTDVGIGSIMSKPVDINTEAKFDGYVYGLGAMLTGGVRSIFFSLDASKIWTHLGNISNNNSAVNVGLRTGYIFHFHESPEKNISVWTGATRIFLSNTTEGTVKLSDIAPDFGENYQNTDWYQELTPVNKALVDDIVTKAVDQHSNDVIHYTLKKRPSHNWTMVLGSQFQLNRHWQFRAEANLFGGRESLLLSANYRFGLFPSKKKQQL